MAQKSTVFIYIAAEGLNLATFHTPYPQTLGPTVQTSVAWPT